MKIIYLDKIDKNLKEILKEVEKGEEVVLKTDKNEFLISPIKKRKLGFFKDKIKISEDIEKPLPAEITEEFYK